MSLTDAAVLGPAIVGDCNGDWNASLESLKYWAIIGGRRGVDTSCSWSSEFSCTVEIPMSMGLDVARELARALGGLTERSFGSVRAGEKGGVTMVLRKSLVAGAVIDRMPDSLSELVREGGALRKFVPDMEVEARWP